MLQWALTWFVLAIAAAIFGFTRLGSFQIARALFFVFFVLTIIALLVDAARRPSNDGGEK